VDTGAPAVEPVAPATAPRCRRHPEDPEADDCDRCGAFACDACLKFFENKYLCVDCVGRELASLPPLEGRARAARTLLLACAVFDALAVFTPVFTDRTVAGVLYPVTVAACGVTFLYWYALAVRVANRLEVGPGASPWAATGSWLFPLVGWVRPFEHVRLMLRQLGRHQGAVTPWQLLFVGSNLAAMLTFRAQQPFVAVAWLALDFSAALAARRVVLLLTTALSQRRSARAAVVG
jgi:hypothetical protein